MFKKGISAIIAGVLLASAATAMASNEYFILSAGDVSVKGTLAGTQKNETVSFMVTKEAFDWTDETQWKNADNADKIVYSTENAIGDINTWTLAFALQDSGIYNIYAGAGGERDETTPSVLKFVNSERNSAAIETILSEDGDITAVLENKADLGIFENCFDDADNDAAEDVIRESVKDKEKLTYEEALDIVRNSLLVSMLNDGKVTEMDEFMFCFENADWIKLYEKEFSAELAESLSEKDIKTTEALKEQIAKNLVLMQVNKKDGAEAIKKLLKDNAESLGIKTGDISSALCEDIMDEGEFKDIDELIDFIKAYDDKGSSSSGGSSGGSGSSGIKPNNTSKNNSYSGLTVGSGVIAQDKNSNTNVEMKVFDDIDNFAWASEAILQLYKMGVVDGKGDRIFAPSDNVTREEFAKMITLAFNMNLQPDEYNFLDVTEADWSYPYVRTAVAADITNGISETLFGKGMNITRQDLCTMAYKALNAVNYSGQAGQIAFSDNEAISDYAKDAVAILVGEGVISGYGDNSFKPQGYATRAEAAKIIYGVVQLIK